MNLKITVLILIVVLIIFYFLRKPKYKNYINYANTDYELQEGYVYKLNENDYNISNKMKIYITDDNLQLFIICNKLNYSCDGLVGDKYIASFIKTKKNNIFNLNKNSECFPNGGLMPEFIVVTKKNKNWNSYWGSIEFKHNDNYKTDELIQFFEKFRSKN
jgi:hypothetical protein